MPRAARRRTCSPTLPARAPAPAKCTPPMWRSATRSRTGRASRPQRCCRRGRVRGSRAVGYEPASSLHDDGGANLGPVIQVDDVLVGHTNAARRDAATELPRLVGAVDAVKRVAEIERPRTERIIRPAGHVTRQIGKPLQFTWRGRPVRPFAFGGNRADPRPSVALHANGDTIANGLAAAEHVVQPPLTGADDDRSG